MESAINKYTPRYYNDIIIVTVDPHMTMWTKHYNIHKFITLKIKRSYCISTKTGF